MQERCQVAAYGKQQISKVASFRLCTTMQYLLEMHMHTRKTASQPASQTDRQTDTHNFWLFRVI